MPKRKAGLAERNHDLQKAPRTSAGRNLMGFDLEAKNQEAGRLHLDAGAWSLLRQGLALLEADTSAMAKHGDGPVVGREVALDWANRLEAGVTSGRLKVKSTPEGELAGERREFSLQEGSEARHSDKAPWLKDFICFAKKSDGFEQTRS